MRILTIFLAIFIYQISFAADITSNFYKKYNGDSQLNQDEVKNLSNTKIIFIPGILAETFQEDPRSVLNLSFLTKEYFGTQVNHLKRSYNLDVLRLKTSSKTLEKTKINILNSVKLAKKQNKKVIFIAHSLGGLALTEVLLEQETNNQIKGVIFLQTPFSGSPIANVYDRNTYYIKKLLKPLLPFFNTSEEIITYLKMDTRKRYMNENWERLKDLETQIPIISIASTANNSFSLFHPAVDIMEYGCLTAIRGRCITNTIYNGDKDQSDGMVPVSSGLFPKSEYLILKGVDHGETVVNLGPRNINRKKMVETFLHLLLKRI